MISLSFHAPLVPKPVRVGPAPWFRITGNYVRQGPHNTIAGTYHHGTWETDGQHFTSYDVEGTALVHFEDAFGDQSPVLGPFDILRTANGVMWAKTELFAKFIAQTQLWHHAKTDTYWPALVIKSVGNWT